METGQPSRTAYAAARYRAAHQVLERGSIFTDPLAVRILGATAEELRGGRAAQGDAAVHRGPDPRSPRTRWPRPCERGVSSSSSCSARGWTRSPTGTRSRGCGSSRWTTRTPRRGSGTDWREAGIEIPTTVSYLGVDFETESLADRLRLAGPAFFFWLGVVPYLTREGFDETLAFVAAGAGNEVVFDYAQSPERMPAERRAALEARAARVARIGEPWLTYFEPHGDRGRAVADSASPRSRTWARPQLAARFFDRPDVPAGHAGRPRPARPALKLVRQRSTSRQRSSSVRCAGRSTSRQRSSSVRCAGRSGPLRRASGIPGSRAGRRRPSC